MSTLAPPPSPGSTPALGTRDPWDHFGDPHPAEPSPSPSPARATRVRAQGTAEIALAAVTVAAAIALGRLFTGTAYVGPLLVAAVASHALAWAGRRAGPGPIWAAVVSGAGLVLTVGWVVEPHTLTYGLPLGPTWDVVRGDLADAWERFGVVRAPVEAAPGFLVAAVGATWLTGFLADSFAFRFRARFEALLPSFVLFLFGAMLGADRHRLAATAVYLWTILAFGVLSGAGPAPAGAWLGGRTQEGDLAVVRRGLATALVVLVAALVLGPNLPGAQGPALLSWRDGERRRSSSRVTPSPLVEIRSRLLQPSGAEVFTVRSRAAAYWRLTSLDRFDGDIWSSLGRYRPADERLPSGVSDAGVEVLDQHFEIRNLSSIWLPAAYRPERLDGLEGVRYDPDSSSLLAEAETSNGLVYSVASAQPRLQPEQLRLASTKVPPEVAGRHLGLPPDFPDRIRALAGEVVHPETTAYGRAKTLQDWFRSEFTYDLGVSPGHDKDAMAHFLFVDRRGYCEQFAGAYAAMARSLGLPARVAVGFAPGQTAGDGVFRVTDREAHAWPEVYIAGFGWVAFEPTPTRAVPRGEGYTGVPEPSLTPDAPPTTTAADADAPPPPNAAPAPPPGGGAEPAGPGGGRWGPGLLAPALLLVAVLYLAGVPLARRTARNRRRSHARSADDRILAAWEEAQADLALAGVPRRRSETPSEFARRAAAGDEGLGRSPATSAALEQLAVDAATAAFAPGGAPEQTATRAEQAAARVHTELQERASPWQRAKWALDPRSLRDLLRSGGR